RVERPGVGGGLLERFVGAFDQEMRGVRNDRRAEHRAYLERSAGAVARVIELVLAQLGGRERGVGRDRELAAAGPGLCRHQRSGTAAPLEIRRGAEELDLV